MDADEQAIADRGMLWHAGHLPASERLSSEAGSVDTKEGQAMADRAAPWPGWRAHDQPRRRVGPTLLAVLRVLFRIAMIGLAIWLWFSGGFCIGSCG